MVKEAGEGKPRLVGKRHRGREMALQMLYQSDLGGASLRQVLSHFDPGDLLESYRDDEESGSPAPVDLRLHEALEYARRLVTGTVEHLDEVDGLIRRQADNWRLERMSAVDRNVLRLAVYELCYEEDVPKLVVIDEAIELAKRYGSEQSGRFVNGLLDGILRSEGEVVE